MQMHAWCSSDKKTSDFGTDKNRAAGHVTRSGHVTDGHVADGRMAEIWLRLGVFIWLVCAYPGRTQEYEAQESAPYVLSLWLSLVYSGPESLLITQYSPSQPVLMFCYSGRLQLDQSLQTTTYAVDVATLRIVMYTIEVGFYHSFDWYVSSFVREYFTL